MSDLAECYQHAARCAEELAHANAQKYDTPKFRLQISAARRYLARALTAYGSPTETHRRRLRLCREALEALESAAWAMETTAPRDECDKQLKRANRRLRRVRY